MFFGFGSCLHHWQRSVCWWCHCWCWLIGWYEDWPIGCRLIDDCWWGAWGTHWGTLPHGLELGRPVVVRVSMERSWCSVFCRQRLTFVMVVGLPEAYAGFGKAMGWSSYGRLSTGLHFALAMEVLWVFCSQEVPSLWAIVDTCRVQDVACLVWCIQRCCVHSSSKLSKLPIVCQILWSACFLPNSLSHIVCQVLWSKFSLFLIC